MSREGLVRVLVLGSMVLLVGCSGGTDTDASAGPPVLPTEGGYAFRAGGTATSSCRSDPNAPDLQELWVYAATAVHAGSDAFEWTLTELAFDELKQTWSCTADGAAFTCDDVEVTWVAEKEVELVGSYTWTGTVEDPESLSVTLHERKECREGDCSPEFEEGVELPCTASFPLSATWYEL